MVPRISHLFIFLLLHAERSHPRGTKYYCGCPKQTQQIQERYMGLRYYRMQPSSGKLSTLPGPTRTAIEDFFHYQAQKPRGAIREANDKTMESRAVPFTHFLADHNYSPKHLYQLTDITAQSTLAVYLDFVLQGTYLAGSYQRTKLMGWKTLYGYLTAAEAVLQLNAKHQLNIKQPCGTRFVPMLDQILRDRQVWQEPKDKINAYTFDMLDTFFHFVSK